MDINTLRSLATVLVAVASVGVCWWAFSPKRKKRFEEDAQLPFADEKKSQESAQAADHHRHKSAHNKASIVRQKIAEQKKEQDKS